LSIEHFNKRRTRQDLRNKEKRIKKGKLERRHTRRGDALDTGIHAICIISNGKD